MAINETGVGDTAVDAAGDRRSKSELSVIILGVPTCMLHRPVSHLHSVTAWAHLLLYN